MSRDFTLDFDDFREAARSPRESSRPSSDTRAGATRTREEFRHPESRSRDVREPRPKELPPRGSRAALYDRYRSYELRESEIQTLADLGKFRVINTDDLARHGYGGDKRRMEQEITSLVRQGLVEEKQVEISLSKSTRMFTLTKAGRRLMQGSGRLRNDQEIYSGFVKPREAKHDAELYRVYQREEDRIERRGGRVRRVLLDFELKKKVNRDLARLGLEKDDSDKKGDIAERYGLRVVHGNGAAMPFAEGSFSGVVSLTMLHHVPTAGLQDRLLAEARRVLRPDSVFAGFDGVGSLLFKLIHLGDTYTPVDPDTFGRRLAAVGFTDVAVERGWARFRFRARRR